MQMGSDEANVVRPSMAKQGPEAYLKEMKRREHQRSFFSFFLPFIILALSFAVQNVFPFGDRHILTVDLYHQYAPFLLELRDKLLSGESLFLSWRGGLGYNFYATFTYYLASPLNLLSLIFPESALSELVSFLVLLKIGLAGFCFHLFLKKSSRRDGPLALAFATAYALSGFVMAFFWNIMWLDTLYMLPLTALGMIILLRDGKMSLYIFSLALLIICNFYTGFFACVFLAFYFFVCFERVSVGCSPSSYFLSLSRMLISTLLGAGLSMISLFPTIIALRRTSASGDSFPADFTYSNPFIDFLSRLLPFAKPSIRSGMANIYVGSFVLLLFFVYLSSQKIPPGRKTLNLSLLAFLFFSFNNNVANFIWHGLHYPNQLPYRNSFVFCFFILVMMYEALPSLRQLELQYFWPYVGGLALLLMLLNKMDAEAYTVSSVYLGIAFILLYALFFSLYSTQKLKRGGMAATVLKRFPELRKTSVLSIVLLTLMLAELCLNSLISISSVADSEYFGSREDYKAGPVPEQIATVADKLRRENPHEIRRMEILDAKTVNDPALYRLDGISIFNSTYPQKPVELMGKLGLSSNGINSYQFLGSTPVLDSLLGLRYLFCRQGVRFDPLRREKIYSSTELDVYECPSALPLAFLAPEQLISGLSPQSDVADFTPFRTQTYLFRELTGAGGIFENQNLSLDDSASVGFKKFEGQKPELMNLSRDENQNGVLEFEAHAEVDGDYYVAWKADGLHLSEVKRCRPGDEIKLGSKASNVTQLGHFKKGEEFRIRVAFDSESASKSGTFKLWCARLNDEVYDEAIAKIQAEAPEFSRANSSELVLRTHSDEARSLFFSITEDPGWTCFVDGEEQALSIIENCFMAVPLSAGEHQVRMSFCPQGFRPGAIVSLLSLLPALGILVYELLSSHKKKAKTQSLE